MVGRKVIDAGNSMLCHTHLSDGYDFHVRWSDVDQKAGGILPVFNTSTVGKLNAQYFA